MQVMGPRLICCTRNRPIPNDNGHDMKAQKTATKTQMYFQQKRKCRINKTVDIISLANAVPTSSEGNNDSPKNNTNLFEIAEFLSIVFWHTKGLNSAPPRLAQVERTLTTLSIWEIACMAAFSKSLITVRARISCKVQFAVSLLRLRSSFFAQS